MTSKFVVRLLDAEGALLSWAEVYASPRPQERGASCPFFPTAPTKFAIEKHGIVTQMSVHWADLDVARLRDMTPTEVQPGQVFDFIWIEPVWLVPGMRDVPLPTVTVRGPVHLGIPQGTLGASSP